MTEKKKEEVKATSPKDLLNEKIARLNEEVVKIYGENYQISVGKKKEVRKCFNCQKEESPSFSLGVYSGFSSPDGLRTKRDYCPPCYLKFEEARAEANKR